MNLSRWLTIIGGALLLIGVLTALISNHYATRVMGKAALGVAVLAPDPESLEWKNKERLRARADCWFWIGVIVTAAGIVLQTVGAVLPER